MQQLTETCVNKNINTEYKATTEFAQFLKVSIWYDHLYSSTQPEPSQTIFLVISLSNLQE